MLLLLLTKAIWNHEPDTIPELEVARIIARKFGEQSNKKSDENLDLADELADVIFVLICLANQTGIDLEEAIIKNIAKKTSRDAQRHVENKKINN